MTQIVRSSAETTIVQVFGERPVIPGVAGGAGSAGLIPIEPIPGVAANNVQDAIAELSQETQTYWLQTSNNVVSQSLHTYIVNHSNPSPVQIILPINAPAGFSFRVFAVEGTFQITQNAGQQIRMANVLTTQGVTGSVQSQSPGDSIYLSCGVANALWIVLSMIGNFDFI
ncbi:MAG: hypothetical protein ACRC4J_03580 [Cetobacterium sp.]